MEKFGWPHLYLARWLRASGGGEVKCHLFCHRDAVLVSQMAVRHRDEHPSVFVAEPPGDHFEIASGFNRVRAKEMTHRVMSEVRELRFHTGRAEGLLG